MTNPNIKKFIDYAYQKFHEATGDKLFIDRGKDGTLVKTLLSTYTLDELKSKWDLFLKSDDPFIQQAGYSIGVFKVSLNKLIVKKRSAYAVEDKPIHEPVDDPIDPKEVRKFINEMIKDIK